MKTGSLNETLQLLDEYERELWRDTVMAMTRAEMCRSSEAAIKWGDDVVLAYRNRTISLPYTTTFGEFHHG